MKPLLLAALAAMLALLQGCASLPPMVDRTPVLAIPASSQEALGRIAALSVPAGKGSGFRPLPLAAWSMDARLALVRNAQKSLDIQYYLLQNDLTGHALVRAVRDAALRGVRVRLLVDDLYTANTERLLADLAAYPNVEIRLFNPFPTGRAWQLTRWILAAGDFSRVNHRMHNKLLIADGAFAIAGGRNIADEYFFNSKGSNFVDFDLLVAGEAVPRLAGIFDIYWNSERVFPLHSVEPRFKEPPALRDDFEKLTADAVSAFPSPPPNARDLLGYLPLSADLKQPPLKLLYGRIDAFADDPEKVSGRASRGDDETTVTTRVMRTIGEAKAEVVLSSPYFVPGKLGMEGLGQALNNDVRIEVMTNSLASNDEPFASAGYARYRLDMLKMGVDLFEIDSSQLKNDSLIGAALHATIGRSHSKLIVVDRQTTFVGSMNLDLRSSRINTELGMLVYSPELAENVLTLADRVRDTGSFRLRLAQPGDRVQWIGVDHGVEKVYDSEPGVSLGTKLQLLLLFPFISESLL
ncbi:phospholipase D family protein [Variovorax sp. dw_308]|uniref:phospholipase D family protein n=1 Tax=Variovorax sp. dw_308 TaxID=2721546 RepID=UPI00210A41CD|nr:phospholipase D family protein [Variovorax sp. dw_308]